MELKSSIRRPDAVVAITKIKRQMHKRWSSVFTALQAFTNKNSDQIVDDVVIDIDRGIITWNYGQLEAVLAFWSHRRILGELKNAGLRRKTARRFGLGVPADEPLEDQEDAAIANAQGLWRGTLPSQEDALTRIAVMQLCGGRDLETQLAQMVLEDPGLIADKSFKGTEIHEEFKKRDVPLTIEEVHALIARFRKILQPLVPENSRRRIQKT